MKKGWSQRMLADHAQIEQAHLARLETGQVEPGVLVLEKIATALEVEVFELFR
jgi:transcriptional regulator with XRE-family HTH domain